MTLIETRKLSKRFVRGSEAIAALNQVDLRIEIGEFVSITGPSGSGKSTLLYILGLIDSPTSGEYLLEGQPTASLSDAERAMLRNRKMGFVFQSFHLLPRATALRNVMMPLVYGRSHGAAVSAAEMRERAAAALERVGLKERMQHRPNELSGGQRQRVAIARALVTSPRIIFADEPTGNLDSRTGQEVMALFDELRANGVTIVLVTHDPNMAARAARQLVLRDGVITSDTQQEAPHVPA